MRETFGEAMVRLRPGWLLLAACVAGCASAPSPEGVSGDAAGVRRVLQIFARGHLRPRTLDGELSREVFQRVVDALEAGPCVARHAELEPERGRVLDALREGDFSLPERVAERCQARALAPARARALLLDAFARAHDPHSAYLDADGLAALRRAIHRPAEATARVRARVVEHAGTRIGVLRVPAFYLDTAHGTATDARQLLRTLADRGAEVVLVDLRGNGGGVEAEAGALFGVFAGEAPWARIASRRGTRALRGSGAVAWDGPLVLVVDARTASVAEAFVAAIQDRRRGLVVGQRTQGKGTGQTLVLLSSPQGGREGAVRVTDRSYHRASGAPLQKLGVTPDVELAPAAAAPPTERERAGALDVPALPAQTSPDDASPPPPRADLALYAAVVSFLSSAPAPADAGSAE